MGIDFNNLTDVLFKGKKGNLFENKDYRRIWIKNYLNDGIQNVHTPFELCSEMLGKTKEIVEKDSKNIVDLKFLVLFNLEFVEVLISDYGVSPKNICYFTDSSSKGVMGKKYGCEVIHAKNNALKELQELSKGENMKKFDCIIQNPPYATKSDKSDTKTQSLWDKFVKLSFDLAKKDGYICAVHPTGWRFPASFSSTGQMIKEKQVEYLEMHDNEDGQKTFGVSTCYDWYVIKNTENNKETIIKDRDGNIISISIKDVPFIPNSMIEKIFSLLAKNKEEAVKILYDTAYHHQKVDLISDRKDNVYKYPCVYSISTKNELILKYSSTNSKGHFGIPKIIIGAGCNFGVYQDTTGEYGMTEWAFGIIDDVNNFANITKVLMSKEFQLINRATTTKNTAGVGVVDKNIIKYFKKDFWREFE